jgi:hypothetical protein
VSDAVKLRMKGSDKPIERSGIAAGPGAKQQACVRNLHLHFARLSRNDPPRRRFAPNGVEAFMKRQLKHLTATALVLAGAWRMLAQNPLLTTMEGPDAASTLAWGVNQYRDVVGLYVSPDKTDHGFLYRLGKMTAIDYPGASSTDVYGINSRGDIVGGYVVKWREPRLSAERRKIHYDRLPRLRGVLAGCH